MKIAYITYSGAVKYSAANGFNEHTDLLPFLKSRGLDIEKEIWDDPTVDWARYDVALLKTPWDYHQKIEQFNTWLDKLESLGIRLLNDYTIVRWNMDKHYLKEIAAAGARVIPSLFLDKNNDWQGDPISLFDQFDTDSIIIKPCISGGSKDTIVINRSGNAARAQKDIAGLLTKGDFIVQPLMPQVRQGEWSHIFFNGKHSHSILKRPAAGDFRVQQIYGGTIEPLHPTRPEIAHAASYLHQFADNTLYARVDGLMIDNEFTLMELELIEPFLYLSYAEHALENYYKAILNFL